MHPINPITRCPFCAGDKMHIEETDMSTWAVVCESCGTIGPVARDALGATYRWDSRDSQMDIANRGTPPR